MMGFRSARLMLGVVVTIAVLLAGDVNAQSRRAHEWSGLGIGTRTQLKLQWDSATNPVYFNVVTASFDAIGEGSHSSFLRVSKTLRDRVLTLECERAGIRSSDARHIGCVFRRLSTRKVIECVGFVRRSKGHGSAGGRLWRLARHESV